MSRNTDRINHKITNKESYALIEKPTNATFISKETMETNEEKTRKNMETQGNTRKHQEKRGETMRNCKKL